MLSFHSLLSSPLAERALSVQVPANFTIDQAAAVPVAFDTAALGLYCPKDNNGGAGLSPPWEKGGRGKYAGQPILILGGSTSVAQAGESILNRIRA